MDIYGIDSHKLIFHPDRVSAWLSGHRDWESAKGLTPIYVEMSPYGACNHRCSFCALDYMGYEPRVLGFEVMQRRIPEMAGAGVKSVMFAGEGEPLLYRQINELSRLTKESGIDIALTTNGVFLNDRFVDSSLELYSWIKVSFNAGTPETYAAVHGTKPGDFAKVVANLKRAAKAKRDRGLSCVLGVQMLLLPENAGEVERLAAVCRDEIGADYLVLKPYSQHLSSIGRRYQGIDYAGLTERYAAWETYSTEGFQVICRSLAIGRNERPKTYATCLSTPFFWAYVASGGDVYSCSAFLGDERFNLGNLNESGFSDIWEGERRRRNFELVRRDLDIASCRLNCRMDAINQYLWALVHRHPHVNFI